MSSGAIGSLRVILGADTSDLDRSLKASSAGLASFGSGVTLAMAAAAASVAGAAYSIVGSIKATIASADHLNSLSQAAGLTVEEFSKLNYAAGLSDVSTEQLSGSLGKLTKAMSSAAQDGAGPAAQAFAALGLAVKNQDGTLKSSSMMLGEVADKFSGYRDGASKTALAIAIFGEAGANLIPMLNKGSEGLRAAGEEAQNFGLVLDKKTTLAAEAFHENLKKADAVTQGLIVTITAKLLPTMEMLSSQWLEFSKDVDLSMKAIDLVTSAINAVIREIKIAYVELGAFGSQVANLYETLKQIAVNPLSGSKIWGDYAAAADQAAKQVDAVVASIRTVGTASDGSLRAADWLVEGQALKSLNREVTAYGEAWKPNAPVIAAGKGALDKFIDSQNKSVAAQQAEIATFGMLEGQRKAATAQLQAEAIAASNSTTISAAQQAQLDLLKQSYINNGLALQGLQVTQQNLLPVQAYQIEMQKLQMLFDAGTISLDTFTLASQNAADKFGQSWTAVGGVFANVAGSLSNLTGTFAKNNKAMGIASKAFGIAQAIINAQIAATKALATYGPTPMGYAGVAAAIAQGAASVATISAQSFASGGFVSGPGTSVSDSIPAMLSNGEFVMNANATRLNRPQLEAMNAGAPSGGATQPTVVTLAMGAGATREWLRETLDGLNGMLADGYVLNVKPA